MKKILGSTFGAMLIACSAPALAQGDAAPIAPATAPLAKPAPIDPASLALAHQIVAIAFPPEKRSEVFASRMDLIVEQVRKSMESLGTAKDKDFQAIVERSTERMFDQLKVTINAALPDYFESVARAYARDFSPDDLNAILAFVKTPAGQHYFE